MNKCSAPLDSGYYPRRVESSPETPASDTRGRVNSLSYEVEVPQAPAEIARLLSRRQVLQRATVLGLGGLVLSALPAAERILATVDSAHAAVALPDATLQAVAD